MKASHTSQLILEELKTLMKNQRVTYRDLAPKVKLSESGLKKLMTSQDCSVGKLERICQALGVQLLDVIHNMERTEVRGLEYRPEQEAYFESHHEAFLFYWLLAYERRNIEEASEVLGLTPKEADKIKFQLDRLNLIMRKTDGDVRVPDPVALEWIGKSNFVRKIFHNWSLSLAKRVARPDRQENETFMIHYLQMSEQTWTDFIAAQKNVQQVFLNRAVREMRLKSAKRIHARWIFAADRRSFVEEELGYSQRP